MRKNLIIFILFISSGFAFVAQPVMDYPNSWPTPSYNFDNNPLSSSKVELGRMLFYDPILSRDSSVSCASCHSSFNAFTHVDHDLSHGIDDRVGNRNSPALMNLAWHDNFMWDGAINHLDMQALAPMHDFNEMDSKIEDVVARLKNKSVYPNYYRRAFGSKEITGEKTLKAIAQFLLTIVSSNSKYDKVQGGQDTFSQQEQKGFVIYKDNCSSCHTEPLFRKNGFANNGLRLETSLNDFGRMTVTKKKADSLKFKIPTLRNIEYTYPYMHDGRFNTLREVLNHYTDGIVHSASLANELRDPIILSSNDKVDLTAFLLTLSDKQFLFDQRYQFPKALMTIPKD